MCYIIINSIGPWTSEDPWQAKDDSPYSSGFYCLGLVALIFAIELIPAMSSNPMAPVV